jgi:hypothetical protein
MIIDNPEVLRSLVRQYVVPEGHPHSEDLVQDPTVVRWINEYAREYRKIVDPIWERRICDPGDRWFCEGAEYCNLFRFHKCGKSSGEKRALAPVTENVDTREPSPVQRETVTADQA